MEKVLIIDDNPTDRIVQMKMLESQYDVKSVANPYEGEEAIREWDPDIVVIDYAMPKMNGIQAIKYFKDRTGYDGIYLILTGLDDINIATEAIRQGAYDYMVKPLTSEIFNHKIKNCMNYRKLLKNEKEKIANAAIERIILSIYYELNTIYVDLNKYVDSVSRKFGPDDAELVGLQDATGKLGNNINKLASLDEAAKKEYVEIILDYYLK